MLQLAMIGFDDERRDSTIRVSLGFQDANSP
jgi:hypothetical protein